MGEFIGATGEFIGMAGEFNGAAGEFIGAAGEFNDAAGGFKGAAGGFKGECRVCILSRNDFEAEPSQSKTPVSSFWILVKRLRRRALRSTGHDLQGNEGNNDWAVFCAGCELRIPRAVSAEGEFNNKEGAFNGTAGGFKGAEGRL
eukprot:1195708-Prorocentrum_minimum.AAC.10